MRFLAVTLLAVAAATAAAQDPTLDATEMDTTTPPPDESFMDDGDVAFDGSELDTSVPPADDRYLDEEVGPPGPSAEERAAAKSTPGPALLLVLAALGAAALTVRRR